MAWPALGISLFVASAVAASNGQIMSAERITLRTMSQSTPTRPPTLPSQTPAMGRVMVNLPLNDFGLVTTVERLSIALSVSTGSEVFTGLRMLSPGELVAPPVGRGTPSSNAATPSRSPQAYDLTGLSMPEALSKLVEWMPEYAWTQDNGVYHLRPQAQNPFTQALDLKVDRFAREFDNVQTALSAIRDLIDATLPRTEPRGGSARTTTPSVSRPTLEMQKPIAFDLTNVTIRQLLDALVTQHGRLFWTANGRYVGNGSTSLLLRVQGFDGSSVTASAIVR